MAFPTQWGKKTPKAVIYKSEAHKLHQTFEVVTGKKIFTGEPVFLIENGKVIGVHDLTGYPAISSVELGISIGDSQASPYRMLDTNKEQTVLITKGCAIIWAKAHEAISAGKVKVTYDPNEFQPLVSLNPGPDDSTGIALTPANANDLVQVLV